MKKKLTTYRGFQIWLRIERSVATIHACRPNWNPFTSDHKEGVDVYVGAMTGNDNADVLTIIHATKKAKREIDAYYHIMNLV